MFIDKYALHAYNYCKPQSTVGLLLLAALDSIASVIKHVEF